ncbi:MAG: pseudouridine synthase [Oceanospirillaceae bacterium]|nr:pseudouridine synthase [Oceanospirillaceae bacterium]
MGRSVYPSTAVTPTQNTDQHVTVLAFLVARFPQIPEEVWCERMRQGYVHWEDNSLIDEHTPFKINAKVLYYRDVPDEPVIPFDETVIFQDHELLVACKPHFLPVTPGGVYVEQCLLNRLRQQTGIKALTPIHRIDRDTAGLVMFSVNPETRGSYQQMFAQGTVKKTYHAVAACDDDSLVGRQWLIENRMEKAEQWFRMAIKDGDINARSTVSCLMVQSGRALFELSPLTGKTHQLRVHMDSLGYPLENDRLYPVALPQAADDYSKPLQLLAREVAFTDPVTGKPRHFISTRELSWAG